MFIDNSKISMQREENFMTRQMLNFLSSSIEKTRVQNDEIDFVLLFQSEEVPLSNSINFSRFCSFFFLFLLFFVVSFSFCLIDRQKETSLHTSVLIDQSNKFPRVLVEIRFDSQAQINRQKFRDQVKSKSIE